MAHYFKVLAVYAFSISDNRCFIAPHLFSSSAIWPARIKRLFGDKVCETEAEQIKQS